MIVTDGIYRGEVGRVMAAGGGLVWVKIAGVEGLIALATSGIDFAHGRRPDLGPTA